MSMKQIPVAEFCEHAVNTLQAMEATPMLVELVRDGEVVAYLSPAPKSRGKTRTLADWAGTGSGFALPSGSGLDDPAFEPEEWEGRAESAA